MNRRKFLISTTATSSYVTILQGAAGATLEVHATYTGSGPVDESHKFYVAVWDSTDFMKDGASAQKPLAATRIMSKSGTTTFKDIQKSPVFVSMAYDATGRWSDPQNEPPSGSSLGIYSKEPGVPAPIDLEPGKTTKISAELDDSFQKP